MRTMVIACGAMLASVSGVAMAEETLFEQAPGLVDIRAQDASGSIPGARHADDVSFDQAVEVTTIQWWGSYVPVDLENPTSLDAFSVTIFEDGVNVSGESTPGRILFEDFVFVTAVDTGEDIAGVVDQYLYTATLPAPIQFDANTVYWFHPLNNTGLDSEGSWGWEPTLPGPGRSWAFFNLGLPQLGWRIEDDEQSNFAFRLLGTPVTAPCPLDLDGSGQVDFGDILSVLTAWGTPEGDVDEDGTTGFSDVLAILAGFGDC
jgi:hypothetical protein